MNLIRGKTKLQKIKKDKEQKVKNKCSNFILKNICVGLETSGHPQPPLESTTIRCP